MHLLGIFFTAWIVGFSGAMMPGPLLTVTISESAKRGGKAGPLLMIGHSILELALVAALVVGLKSYLSNERFITIVSVLGGFFLLWMGYGMIKEAWTGKVSLDLAVKERSAVLGPIMTGILVSVSNPYWTIWWATFGLSYITKAWVYGFGGLAFFYMGHILADFSWYGAVSFAVSKGKGLMSDRLYRGIIAVCGAFLIGLAVTFIKAGISQVF
ncbi:MAG: LysE family transporter [Eubacteriales bacterium]